MHRHTAEEDLQLRRDPSGVITAVGEHSFDHQLWPLEAHPIADNENLGRGRLSCGERLARERCELDGGHAGDWRFIGLQRHRRDSEGSSTTRGCAPRTLRAAPRRWMARDTCGLVL